MFHTMKVNNVANKGAGLKSSEEDIIMGISESDHLTLLNSLTNLYANPIMAALREYCANASDAHKVSGQVKPFEVEFPYRHEGESSLRIRDYGNGMTKEQIIKIYSQYGASTKGSSNLTVGGFGLGSKSGLAVSNHLYINTTANGILIRAQILKNEDNTSVIRILSEEPSSADAGTEIILPVTKSQLAELTAKADEELMGYAHTEIMLNSKPLTLTLSDKERFIPVQSGGNAIAYIARRPKNIINGLPLRAKFPIADLDAFLANHINVVMGGVFYRTLPESGSVPDKTDFYTLLMRLMRRLQNSPRVILNIPVGSVDLPPHRDAIIDTKKSWASLISVMDNLVQALDSSSSKYLNEHPLSEASNLVGSMHELFAPNNSWVHQGRKYSNIFDGTSNPLVYTLDYTAYSVGGSKPMNSMEFIKAQTKSGFDYQRATIHSLQVPARGNGKTVTHLKVTQAKFDDLIATARSATHRSPKVNRVVRQYLAPVVSSLYPLIEQHILLMTPDTVELPVHLQTTVDYVCTEAEIRATYRKMFPAKPKEAVTQHHCRLGRDLTISYDLISSNEKVVYFGGKRQYKPSLQIRKTGASIGHNRAIKSIAAGTYGVGHKTTTYPWLRKGLFDIIDSDANLVALSETNTIEDFQNDFTTAVPLGKLIMDHYDKLDSVRKLAVQHAYSILALWASSSSDRMFRYISEQKYAMKNDAIAIMIEEPAIIAIANYIYSLSDSYVEGLEEWKGKFIAEVSSKSLAGSRLLPLNMMIEPEYQDSHPMKANGLTMLPTKMSVQEKGFALRLNDFLGYIDVLTADL